MDSIAKEKLIAKLSADSQFIEQNRKCSRTDSNDNIHIETNNNELLISKSLRNIEPPRIGSKLHNNASILTPVFLPTYICNTNILSNNTNNNSHHHNNIQIDNSNENSIETMVYCEDPEVFKHHTSDQNNSHYGNLKFETNFECGSLYSAYLIQQKKKQDVKDIGTIEEYHLKLRRDHIESNNDRHDKWYFFRVQNHNSGTHRFHLGPFHESFKPSVLDGIHQLIQPVVYSECMYKQTQESWQYRSENIQYSKASDHAGYQLSFTISFPFPGDITYIALRPPYTYTQLQATLLLLTENPRFQSILSVRPLCHTLAGSICDLVTITEQNTTTSAGAIGTATAMSTTTGSNKATYKQQHRSVYTVNAHIDNNSSSTKHTTECTDDETSIPKIPEFLHRLQEQLDTEKHNLQTKQAEKASVKRAIIVAARLKESDISSSWMCEGLIKFLLSSHATATALRGAFVFYIVPMMHPDSVINGSCYSSGSSIDITAQWRNPSAAAHPSVYYLKQLIQRLHEQQDTQLVGFFNFCDQQSTPTGVCLSSSIPAALPTQDARQQSSASVLPDPRNLFLAAGRRSSLINLKASTLQSTTTSTTSAADIGTVHLILAEEFQIPLSVTVCAGRHSTHSTLKLLQSHDYAWLGCVLCAALADNYSIGTKVRPPLEPKEPLSRVRRASMRAASLTIAHTGSSDKPATLDNAASTTIVIGSSAVPIDMRQRVAVYIENNTKASTLIWPTPTATTTTTGSNSSEHIDIATLLNQVDFDLNFDEDCWTVGARIKDTASDEFKQQTTTSSSDSSSKVQNSAVRTVTHAHSDHLNTTVCTTTANTTTSTTNNNNNNNINKTNANKYPENKEVVRVSFTRNTDSAGHSGLPGKQLGGVRGGVSFTVPVSVSRKVAPSTAPVCTVQSTIQRTVDCEQQLQQCTPPLTALTDSLHESEERALERDGNSCCDYIPVRIPHIGSASNAKTQLLALGVSSKLAVDYNATIDQRMQEYSMEAPTTTALEDAISTVVAADVNNVHMDSSLQAPADTTVTATDIHASQSSEHECTEQCDSSEQAEFSIPISMSVSGIDPLHNPLSPVYSLYRSVTPLFSERVTGLLKNEQQQNEDDSTVRLYSRLGTASAVQSRALTPALNTQYSSTEHAQALTASHSSRNRAEYTASVDLPYVRYSALEGEASQVSVEGSLCEPSAVVADSSISIHCSISTVEPSLHPGRCRVNSSEYYTTTSLDGREQQSSSLNYPYKATSNKLRPVFDDSVYGETLDSTIQDLQAQFLQEMGLDYHQLYGSGGMLSPSAAAAGSSRSTVRNYSDKRATVLSPQHTAAASAWSNHHMASVSSKAFPLRRVLYEKERVILPSASSCESSSSEGCRLPELVSEGPHGMGGIRPVQHDKVHVEHKLGQFYVHVEETLRQQQLMTQTEAAITARKVFNQAHILAVAASSDRYEERRQQQQNTVRREWLAQRGSPKRNRKLRRLQVHSDIPTSNNNTVNDDSSRLNTAMFRTVRGDLKSHGSVEDAILRNYTDLLVSGSSGGGRDKMDGDGSWQWLTGSDQGMLQVDEGLGCVGAAVAMSTTATTSTSAAPPTAPKGSIESPRKRHAAPMIEVQLPLHSTEVHTEERSVTPALQKLIRQAAAVRTTTHTGSSDASIAGNSSTTPGTNRGRTIQSPRTTARRLCSPVRTQIQLFADRPQQQSPMLIANTTTGSTNNRTTTTNTGLQNCTHNSSTEPGQRGQQQLPLRLYSLPLPDADHRAAVAATTSMMAHSENKNSSGDYGGSLVLFDGAQHSLDESLQLVHRAVPEDHDQLQRADSEYYSCVHYGQLYSHSLMLEQQADSLAQHTELSGSTAVVDAEPGKQSVLRFNPLLSKRLYTQPAHDYSQQQHSALLCSEKHQESGGPQHGDIRTAMPTAATEPTSPATSTTVTAASCARTPHSPPSPSYSAPPPVAVRPSATTSTSTAAAAAVSESNF